MAVFVSIFIFIISALLGVIAFFCKRILAQVDNLSEKGNNFDKIMALIAQKIETQEKRIEKIEELYVVRSHGKSKVN
jgi:predicted PurR-regulated permease PerM